jgi:hypothetical protein
MSEAENFVLISLIYWKPMKRFQNRSDLMKFWSSGDSTGSRVEKKLNTIDLRMFNKTRRLNDWLNLDASIEVTGRRLIIGALASRRRSDVESKNDWKVVSRRNK